MAAVRLGDIHRQVRLVLRAALGGREHTHADLDARLLVAAACKVEDHQPVLDPGRLICDAAASLALDFAQRRAAGEPVARILGEKAFWGLSFRLNAHTLVPRPETEGIVEEVLRWVSQTTDRQRPLRLIDIGTGSGAIVIALLRELPNATAIAVDISLDALAVARQNAVRHGVLPRFFPVVSDYGAAIGGAFDIIVSNPPYIAESEGPSLAVEVADFDPGRALFAGADGLDAFRQLLPWSAAHHAPIALAVFEHGAEQAGHVRAIATESGMERIACVFDLAGLPRFLKIMWN